LIDGFIPEGEAVSALIDGFIPEGVAITVGSCDEAAKKDGLGAIGGAI